MALSATSPALDLAAPPGTNSPPHDQRGEGFRRAVGLAPDAGAFERQLSANDLLMGAVTDAPWDAGSGLYLQLVAIHSVAPWTLSGFRLDLTGLPPGVRLYNGTGDTFVDVAGPLMPGESRLIVLQYEADSPWLLLNPTLLVSLAPNADFPAPPPTPLMVVQARVLPDGPLTLELGTQPARRYRVEVTEEGDPWVATGPDIQAVSSRTQWKEPEPVRVGVRWYRIVHLP